MVHTLAGAAGAWFIQTATTTYHKGVGFDYNGPIVYVLGHFLVRFRVRVSSICLRVRVSVRIRVFVV